MRTYNTHDAVLSYNHDITEAEQKQHFRKAEQLRKHRDWLRNGCVGPEPSLKRWKTDSLAPTPAACAVGRLNEKKCLQ